MAVQLTMFVDAPHFVVGAFLGLPWCFEHLFLKNPPRDVAYAMLVSAYLRFPAIVAS
ncbi:MAG: hypothetical protein WAW61_18990 [Methylococcaceae bacterium]